MAKSKKKPAGKPGAGSRRKTLSKGQGFALSALAILVIALACFGAYKLFYPKDSTLEETETLVEEDEENTGVLNNGGQVVSYLDYTYYWKYNADSFSSTGVNGNFTENTDSSNELVRRDLDGNETTIYTGPGYGNLFIVNDKIYFQESYSSYASVLLNGADKSEASGFKIWAAQPDGNQLVGTNDSGEILIMEEDGTMQNTGHSDGSYLNTIDGTVYVSSKTDNGTQLSSVDFDSHSLEKVIVIPASSDGTFKTITDLTGKDEMLYAAYGTYEGSGVFFNSALSGIYAVNLETGYSEEIVSNMTAPCFAINADGDDVTVYYADSDAATARSLWPYTIYTANKAYTIESGEETDTDFSVFNYQGFALIGDSSDSEVARLKPVEADYEILIPSSAVQELNLTLDPSDSDEEFISVRSVDQVGNNIYFTVTTARRDASADYGMNIGYERVNTALYVLASGQSSPTLIYQY